MGKIVVSTKPVPGLLRCFALRLAPLLLASGACKSGVSESSGTEGSPSGEAAPEAAPGTPLYSRFLRLTNSQWENSVRDILRLDAPTGQSAQLLHAVSGTTDFDNNERVVVVKSDNWSDFQAAAEAVAANVTVTDEALGAVVATTDATTFIRTFGRRAFRRELTPDEVSSYTTLYDEGPTYSGKQSAFTKGAALVISAMLQSPHFLYRTEMGEAGQALSGFEMAAKLSLWIRNTTPSDAVLDAAADGAFDSADDARDQAEAMLAEPAAVDAIRRMHSQLYKIELLDTISKDRVEGYDDQLRVEFTAAANSFFDYIFSQDRGVRDILTTNVGFAGPLMAAIYGVEVQVPPWEIQQVLLPDRAGWYTQAPFLTQWAINNDPDPIHRGVRVNLDSLCLQLGPPAMMLPSVPALEPNQSNRQRFEALTAGCGGACHNVFINPIGFAFEEYDGLGRYRTSDNGQAVDTTGSYPFSAGAQGFDNSAELMQLVAESPEAHQCWSKKLASYALERDVVDADQPVVAALGAVSQASGGSLKQVMLALVQDDAFRTRVAGAK
jgi:hypothetical protein